VLCGNRLDARTARPECELQILVSSAGFVEKAEGVAYFALMRSIKSSIANQQLEGMHES
jgi:hypothetical protein